MAAAGKTLEDFRAAHAPTREASAISQVFERSLATGCQRFIITSAQNATPVHEAWWAVLLAMAQDKEAELLVIPLRYKNPTSKWSESQENAERWAREVRPFLWNVRARLNSNLTLLADVKTQPTASSPLTGFDAMSLASSGILGHTKLQLRSIPTTGRMAKILTTTGACTVPNYTDSKAGKIGEFHHSLSAVMVELDGEKFYLRQLHFDGATMGCIDLATRYYVKGNSEVGVGAAPPAAALVMGDTHVDFVAPGVETATWGKGGLVELLQPRAVVWHDVLDSYSCTPHHLGNPFIAKAKHASGRDDVRAEVGRAIDYVLARTIGYPHESIIVPSNHDDMLSRWVKRADWKADPLNAEFYLDTALAMVRQTTMGIHGAEYPDPFTLWMRATRTPNLRTLSRDEPCLIAGIECGMHGDKGPNGAKGSIKNLRRVGAKSVIGHAHAPGIDEGCYQVGTSTYLRLEYNHGASGWLNAHCAVNADGKRQLLIIIDDKCHL